MTDAVHYVASDSLTHPYLPKLRENAHWFGWPTEVLKIELPRGEKYSHIWKLRTLAKACRDLVRRGRGRCLVIFTDAFDVVIARDFAATVARIEHVLQRDSIEVLVAGEMNLWPCKAVEPFFLDDTLEPNAVAQTFMMEPTNVRRRHERLENFERSVGLGWHTQRVVAPFPNTGLVAGHAEDLDRLLNDDIHAERDPPFERDDQLVLTRVLVAQRLRRFIEHQTLQRTLRGLATQTHTDVGAAARASYLMVGGSPPLRSRDGPQTVQDLLDIIRDHDQVLASSSSSVIETQASDSSADHHPHQVSSSTLRVPPHDPEVLHRTSDPNAPIDYEFLQGLYDLLQQERLRHAALNGLELGGGPSSNGPSSGGPSGGPLGGPSGPAVSPDGTEVAWGARYEFDRLPSQLYAAVNEHGDGLLRLLAATPDSRVRIGVDTDSEVMICGHGRGDWESVLRRSPAAPDDPTARFDLVPDAALIHFNGTKFNLEPAWRIAGQSCPPERVSPAFRHEVRHGTTWGLHCWARWFMGLFLVIVLGLALVLCLGQAAETCQIAQAELFLGPTDSFRGGWTRFAAGRGPWSSTMMH